MLRRHHCRRCGNVFCDTCSSARMPLVHSNYFAPVRVCAKCSVAAKKAHAKMVYQRQTGRSRRHEATTAPRRHSDTSGGRDELLHVASGRNSSFVLLSDGSGRTGDGDGQLEDTAAAWTGQSNGGGRILDDRRDGSELFIGRINGGSSAVSMSSFRARNGDILTSNGRRRRRRDRGEDVDEDGRGRSQVEVRRVSLSALPLDRRDVACGTYSDRERTTSDETDDGGAHNMNSGGAGGSGGCSRDRYADSRFQTLPGEAVLVRNDNVRLRFLDHVEHVGRLYVTNFRLVFSPAWKESVDDSRVVRCGLEEARTMIHAGKLELVDACGLHATSYKSYQAIPLVTIERVKRKEMVETDSGLLEIVGKDFRWLQFVFEGLVSKQTFSKFDRSYALARLHAIGEPEGKVDEFAKFSLERFDGVNGAVDGWTIFDAVTEFQRMGISSFTDRWRLSYINGAYDLCPTYPSVLAVPTAASDRVLAVASKFRSKGRIPVLSWRDRKTGAVICRSSQPLVGLGQKQCDKDVFLIQAIAATNPSSTKLVIIDARPWKNAIAQKTVGRAGYELTEHYETRHTTAKLKYTDMVASEQSAAAAAAAVSAGPTAGTIPEISVDGDMHYLDRSCGINGSGGGDAGRHNSEPTRPSLVLTECKLIFMGIENIHTMRKSYHKLMDLCTTKQNNDKWLDQLASTHWMDHVSRILDSAVEIARIVKEQKSSVLIHCSDGWDRTAQLTSLTELLIDPHYRTIDGFQLLIEKEWCSFGHKFRDRTSHGASNSSNEFSPIFLQWIDCVWQVLVQFPSAFEFNERYLILILDHLYSCRFGTFLYNSERERLEQESVHPTQSLWSYLSTIDRAIVMNPFYRPRTASRTKCTESVTATEQCVGKMAVPAYGSLPNERFKDGFGLSVGLDARCRTTTAIACKSTGSVDLSPLRSEAELADTGAGIHFGLDVQRDRFDNDDLQQRGNGRDCERESDMRSVQSSCPRKLVIMRDLDSGLSFPQSLDASSLSKYTSPLPVAPRSRSLNFCSNAGDSAAVGRERVPNARSSMTSFVVPAEELSASAMWTTSGTGNAAEADEAGRYGDSASCEDVIIPSSSMKSLHFWVHYYLRWDPNSHFDRDASVKLETLHLGLVLQIKALTQRIDTVREGEAAKWEHKMQHSLYDSQNRCDCVGSTTSSLSPLRGRRCCNQRATSGGSTSSQDSGFGASLTTESKDAIASSQDLESQIARLKFEKLERLREAEDIYEEELTRLLREAD
ncbi:unnamed protein product [Hyaloperonospora brassicae]|uniref:phosphatidylinositol-3,5-bisphosphate 3-phosphatase n=1 Tax=Hyaloperonospora brassicae TaxID=162125 RepID=A0AAV0TVV4_HYABA|nr:unnamed protein product [Hyaloperonospora brassicae]